MSTMASQITSQLFTQPFIRKQIKENVKLRVTGLCARKFTGERTKGQQREMLRFEDAIVRHPRENPLVAVSI